MFFSTCWLLGAYSMIRVLRGEMGDKGRHSSSTLALGQGGGSGGEDRNAIFIKIYWRKTRRLAVGEEEKICTPDPTLWRKLTAFFLVHSPSLSCTYFSFSLVRFFTRSFLPPPFSPSVYSPFHIQTLTLPWPRCSSYLPLPVFVKAQCFISPCLRPLQSHDPCLSLQTHCPNPLALHFLTH